VLSDVVPAIGAATPAGHVMALAWAALTEENRTIRAGFRLNRARSREELLGALREFTAPHHNVVYADREGHIGFIAPARVPVRRADNEAMGRVPVPGWDAKYDWQGFLAFEDMPQVQDPPDGELVTANHKITPPGYKPFLGVDWFQPYRAERVHALLAQTPRHTLDSFAAIQADVRSRLAVEVLDVARAALPASDAGKRAQALLQGWSGDAVVDSAAPLVFAAWYRELTRMVYADELGELFPDGWDQRGSFMIPVLKGEPGYERWCDDVRTPVRETCPQLASRAFDLAAVDLARRYGEDSAQWRWGKAHFAASDHRPFGFFPVLDRIFNVAPETAGDSFTVNVGHFVIRNEARPYANTHSGSLRALYDLSDLDRSRYIQSTGQSGNVLSPWYASFAERWARVQSFTIPADRAKVQATHTLRLAPRTPPGAPS
jgi:penicillin amidase